MNRRLASLAFAIVLFQVLCPAVLARDASSLAGGQFATRSDASRYRAISLAPGTPYRDFEVEYPPLALGLFRVLGPNDFSPFRQRLFALQVLCQALTVLMLFRFWGNRAGWSYLAVSTPMLFLVYTGFDLVPVTFAVAGAALVKRRRATAGAVSIVVALFVKVWPAALVPGFVARRQLRASIVAAILGAAGFIGWIVWGGLGGVKQVLTYRNARGWEFESVPGSVLRLLTGDRTRFESGAVRLGEPPTDLRWVLLAATVVVIAAVWWRAGRVPVVEGVAETAAIAALLCLPTLLSLQFLLWPLPWIAIAAQNGVRSLERWAGVVVCLTLLAWIWLDPPDSGRLELTILARNVALLGLFIAAIRALWRARQVAVTAAS